MKKRKGFSLIEVNMAIFVLAGGALALMSLFPMGLRYSSEARNEMRVSAFAERFIAAAQVAAQAPDVKTVEDLADALEQSPFNFKIMDEAGQHDDDNVEHDSVSDVYYRAWIFDHSNEVGSTLMTVQNPSIEKAQLGVQVTAENAKQNKRAIRKGAFYTVSVAIDKRK